MGKIANEELLNNISAKFEQVTAVGEPFGLLTIETGRDQIIALLAHLKNDPALQFIYLTDLTAIHYPEQEKTIGVIYHLHSLVNNVRVRIKVWLAITTCTYPYCYRFMERRQLDGTRNL
jgi:NADH-quinone oxidoreductase subunit C